jgi:hypothetical protein
MPASAETTRRLDLPPPFALVSLRETGDAFAHACRIAPEAGAGTLVRVGRYDVVEFALVLEPAEPLAEARRVFFLGMTALADAIGSVGPPERPVTFEWPGTIRFDGARIGGARLGWPARCAEHDMPDWLVFGAMLTAARIGGGDPGLTPLSTSLEDEQFFEEGDAIVESFARHFMRALDLFEGAGLDRVAAPYLARLEPRRECRLDHNGDLLVPKPDSRSDTFLRHSGRSGAEVRNLEPMPFGNEAERPHLPRTPASVLDPGLDPAGRPGMRPSSSGSRPVETEAERLPLVPALENPAWLDPETGAPRL